MEFFISWRIIPIPNIGFVTFRETVITPSNLFPNQTSEVTKDYDGEKTSSLVTVGTTAASALKALELYESEFPRHTARSVEEYKKTERVLTLALTSSNKEIKRLRSQIQHLSDPKEGQVKQHQKEIAKLEAIVEDQSTKLKAKNERAHEVESELLENKIINLVIGIGEGDSCLH